MKSFKRIGHSLIVKIAQLTDVGHVLTLIKNVYTHIDEDSILFDFCGMIYAKSVATAIFARELKEIVSSRNEKGLPTRAHVNLRDDVTCRYLDHIGFFDFIGVRLKSGFTKVRTRLEQQVAGRIPIVEYSYLYFQRGLGYDPLDPFVSYDQAEKDASTLIESESSKIIAALFGPKNCRGAETLVYCLREAIRNCYEHSYADKYYVLGQTWNNGKSELVILDYGSGLQKSLNKKYHSIASERDAIEMAVKPGVSESDFTGKNRYTNSGFGLYVLCQLAIRFGRLYVASNDKMAVYSKTKEWYDLHSTGTLIALQFNKLPEDFGIALEEIIEEGRSIACSGIYPISPSLLTRLYIKDGVPHKVK